MPDPPSVLRRQHELAVARLSEELLAPLQARTLLAHELAAYRGRKFTAGWRLPAEFSDRVRHLDLLIDEDFPFASPRVALVDAPAPGTFPHIEEDGVLCLLSEESTVFSRVPVAVARDQLAEAYKLVTESLAGANRDDLLHEFLSYWNRVLTPGSVEFVSLVEARPPSRLVRVWRGKDMYVLSEDEPTIIAWMQNRFGNGGAQMTEAAALLWLDRPLYPDEYPKSSGDVWRLAGKHAESGTALLVSFTEDAPEQAIVLLGALSENGPCLAGVTAHPPRVDAFEGRTRNPLENGFRPNKLPPALRARRFWQAATPVVRSEVVRADAAWIHGRGQDSRQPRLACSTVIVIGCGSVGAPVARLLAMAGVGRLVLIDPQQLTWANTGRHPLGAKYVDEQKARSLAKELRESYPHLTIEAHDERWQAVDRENSNLLASCHLIVSATGNWGGESALDEWRRGLSERDVPVVYGWTEAHACAGHAVLVAGREACFACGFDHVGVPRLRVTSWGSGNTLRQEPACGATYQPYGAVELNHTVTLIGELALGALLDEVDGEAHRVWACREPFLTSCGGAWTSEWRALPGHRAEGGFTRSLPWVRNPECDVCRLEG